MKISVVTVCSNSEATIADTVRSFLNQTYPNKEMLVIDCVSTDRTLEIIRSFASDLIRVISEKDTGIYDAMNKGLRLFGGDAVGFLNSDDAYHDSSVLERIAGGLMQADAVYGDMVTVMPHDRREVVRTWHTGPFRPGAFRRGWLPLHPTFYVRRWLAEAVGPFDMSFPLAADFDYMLRTLEFHRPKTCYIERTLVDFRAGGTSQRNRLQSLRESRAILATHNQMSLGRTFFFAQKELQVRFGPRLKETLPASVSKWILKQLPR